MTSATPDLRLPSQPQGITASWFCASTVRGWRCSAWSVCGVYSCTLQSTHRTTASRGSLCDSTWVVLRCVKYVRVQLYVTVDSQNHSVAVTGLRSFTSYSFVVSVCNSVGCVNSSASNGTTLMSGPSASACQWCERRLIAKFHYTGPTVSTLTTRLPSHPINVYNVSNSWSYWLTIHTYTVSQKNKTPNSCP